LDVTLRVELKYMCIKISHILIVGKQDNFLFNSEYV